mmetsp:Transcript_38007/g.88825  ORF Transcript_38007/g.88825 Transcript_38007/m.88825 type:complete len:308 (+) Transcript_38007:750-1673(+)
MSMRFTSSWLQCPNLPMRGVSRSSMSSFTVSIDRVSSIEQTKLSTPHLCANQDSAASSSRLCTSEARVTRHPLSLKRCAIGKLLSPTSCTWQTVYDDSGVLLNKMVVNACASTAPCGSESLAALKGSSLLVASTDSLLSASKSKCFNMKPCTGANTPQGPPFFWCSPHLSDDFSENSKPTVSHLSTSIGSAVLPKINRITREVSSAEHSKGTPPALGSPFCFFAESVCLAGLGMLSWPSFCGKLRAVRAGMAILAPPPSPPPGPPFGGCAFMPATWRESSMAAWSCSSSDICDRSILKTSPHLLTRD